MSLGADHVRLVIANHAQPAEMYFFALPGCGAEGRAIHPYFQAQQHNSVCRWVTPGTFGFLDSLKAQQ